MSDKEMKGDRIYNGLPSKLMNDIYDGLIARDANLIKHKWWAVFSLYLARTCGALEAHFKKQYVPSKISIKNFMRAYNKKVMPRRYGGFNGMACIGYDYDRFSIDKYTDALSEAIIAFLNKKSETKRR